MSSRRCFDGLNTYLLYHLASNLKEKKIVIVITGREGKKECRGVGEGDSRNQREENANRSGVDCLGLRATDAELIKNRRTFLSRKTIWSKRSPVALCYSVMKNSKGKRQNNNRKEEKWSRDTNTVR